MSPFVEKECRSTHVSGKTSKFVKTTFIILSAIFDSPII